MPLSLSSTPRRSTISGPASRWSPPGLWNPADVAEQNADYVPSGVGWIKQPVAEFDLDAMAVVAAAGRQIAYDFLFFDTAIRCVGRAAIIGQ